MNKRKPASKSLFDHQGQIYFFLACLMLIFIVSCAPSSQQTQVQATPSATEPQPPPTQPSPTATSEDLIPQVWITYSSQTCEYSISYPSDMDILDEGTSSRSFGFITNNPDEAARNFIYVSVINQDIEILDGEPIYNYDPAEAGILLNLQVGESGISRDIPQAAEWFSYKRLEDTDIDGHAAQTYENIMPWEFPAGTKEMRYYLTLDGCTYQIGAYLDTTNSDQPGAITEDLFKQIVASIRVTP